LPEKEEVFRLRAEECRRQAEKTRYPDEEVIWRALAEEWLRLASHNERIRLVVPSVSE
jgi:hypothetical protein